MRKKTPKVVITFSTTSDAMALEALSRGAGVPGRIVPVPTEIDAGCGLAWCADACERACLLDALDRLGLDYEGVFEVAMY